MRITRLRLHHYRVFDDLLELELPPGLVGVYGPNGSGKSTLLESIRFALYGRARTKNEEVRTAGVKGDCVAEVEFEHEGHLYVVRRTITGQNHTVRALAHADGLQVAEGARDVTAYVHSILGMDDAAFRASVYAEQKHVDAFSAHKPEERRELVLRLLGIKPIDTARDQARKDAGASSKAHDAARGALPDLEACKAAQSAAEAAAASSETAATQLDLERQAAEGVLAKAQTAYDDIDGVRREHDVLVAEGKQLRAARDHLAERITKLDSELSSLAEAEVELVRLEPEAAGLEQAEARLAALREVDRAERGLAAIELPAEPPAEPDPAPAEAARVAAAEAAEALARVDGELAATEHAVAIAEQAVARSNELGDEADCPLCGQALGDSFHQVRANRAQELAVTRERLDDLRAQQRALATAAKAAKKASARAENELRAAEAAWREFASRRDRRAEAEAALAALLAPLDPAPQAGELQQVETDVRRRQDAARQVQLLRGRLERRAAVASELAQLHEQLASADGVLTALREKVRSLGFSPEQLDGARQALEAARRAHDDLRARAHAAAVEAAAARTRAEESARRVAEALAQHERIGELAEEARHLGRVADLLGGFRNTLVGAIGPQLASHAAQLFAELTDNEYEGLDVDADTYEIRIRDAGLQHGLARFSGSETDLANLALRVAISEHVRFQSGGQVGLLVLDEVFGPLDDERRARMLLALERLRAKFRQVLVVTHANEIKEQLPNAIEVQKLPDRRASARLLASL